MDLNDTDGAVLMGDMCANAHALGVTHGFSVMPGRPLPLAVRWFMGGVISGYANRQIEQVLTSPLGCAWQFVPGTPQGHRAATTTGIMAELDQRLQAVTQLDRRFVFMPSGTTPVPVSYRSHEDGFTLELGGIITGSPGFKEQVTEALIVMKGLGFCTNGTVLPDGKLSLDRGGRGADDVLVELAIRLNGVLANYFCKPGEHRPMVAMWPVPDLPPIFGHGPSARLLHEVTTG